MAGAFEDGVYHQRKKETVGRDTGTAPLKQVTLCLLAEDLLPVGFLSGPWRQTEKVLALAVLSTLKNITWVVEPDKPGVGPGDAKKKVARCAGKLALGFPSVPVRPLVNAAVGHRSHWELRSRVRREEFDKLCNG